MALDQKYEILDQEEGHAFTSHRHEGPHWIPRLSTYALLLISLGLNALQFWYSGALRHPKRWSQEKSEFAGIEYEHNLPWDGATLYNSGNYTEMDRKWGDLRVDDGIIALPKSYAMEKGLQQSEQFPWDSAKDIYLVNGYHGIHCLTQVYLSLKEYREGIPQSHAFEHAAHCLDWLRNDIMCRADDTPLYMSRNASGPQNGVGQYRMCKDWSKLTKWAQENTACYRYGNFVEGDKKWSQIERFKYCPKNSPYLPKIRRYFNESEDWFPTDEEIFTIY